MKTIKVDTWLPVFSGFYGTCWESDSMEEMEIQNINDNRKEKNLPSIDYDAIDWDYEGYRQDVCQSVTDAISGDLESLGMVHNTVYQKLNSPREYNFANDSIDVQFILTGKNVANIKKYLKDHKTEFSKYLKERYTSYDGFFSHYSNAIEAWTGDLMGTLTDAHKLGAVLNFILLNEEGPEYQRDVYESVTGNGCMLSAKNYKKLCETA